MIELVKGNLLAADVEALVNTVNCVGHMGKGIALQFKKAFPDNFSAYSAACRAGQVKPGAMFVFETRRLDNPKYIINFPTKRHWKGKSRMEDILAGLKALAEEIRRRKITSIAVPPLGCGLGGLDWNEVRPSMVRSLQDFPGLHVLLFSPGGTPDPKSMPVGTSRPELTIARAFLLLLMGRYAQHAYRLTLLEIHKLCYFLQESGEPLRLQFKKAYYGPYAANLNKVLERLEGHYTRGYGDTQKPDVDIELLSNALTEAEEFLSSHASEEQKERLNRVVQLIDGFQTPYGMELLSSLHWLAKYDGVAVNEDSAKQSLHAWNPRKRKLFKTEHVRIAWTHLRENGWMS